MIALILILVWLLFRKNETYTSQDIQGLKKSLGTNPAANSAVLGDPKLLAAIFSPGADFGSQLKNTMRDFTDSDVSSMKSDIESYLKSRTPTTVS